MKRICAWCELVMESPSSDSDQVTHGICPPCFEDLMAKVSAAARERRESDSNSAETSNQAGD